MEIGSLVNGTGTIEYLKEKKTNKPGSIPHLIYTKNCSGMIINLNVKGKITKLLKESKIRSFRAQERECPGVQKDVQGASGCWQGLTP